MLEPGLEKKIGEKRAQASRPWVLCLFGSTVQVGPGTAEPVQPKTEYIEP